MAEVSPEIERALYEEFVRRELLARQQSDLIANIRAELFAQQQDFLADPSRNKAALCTRRAGKTEMWIRYATIVCLTIPRCIVRVWGITRLRAKQLLWDQFKLLFARHKIILPKEPNETELTIRFANGSEIRLVGADKDKEVEKKRGDKTALEIVLEAQLFGPFLKKLVEDVAEPSLFDLKGTFCLEGTPGPVCAGYWFDVSGREDFAKRWLSPGNPKSGDGANWSMHRWSVLDNPFLPHAREELAALKKKRRWTDEAPTYVREWLGRWVNDLGALFYKFDPVRNTFTLNEIKPWGPGWEHVLGWDLGARDDMALVVWGYHEMYPTLFEAFSWKQPGALSSEVVAQIKRLEQHGRDGTPFNIIKRFADTGGGGRMYVEDVMARYDGLRFEAAKKTEKYEHVRLLNDDLAGGFVKLEAGSIYAEEMAQLARDADWPPKDKPEAPPREDPRLPNHCCDAGLYAWRGGFHYLHREVEEKPKPGTESWFAAEAKRLEEHVLAQVEKRRSMRDDLEPVGFDDDPSDFA